MQNCSWNFVNFLYLRILVALVNSVKTPLPHRAVQIILHVRSKWIEWDSCRVASRFGLKSFVFLIILFYLYRTTVPIQLFVACVYFGIYKNDITMDRILKIQRERKKKKRTYTSSKQAKYMHNRIYIHIVYCIYYILLLVYGSPFFPRFIHLCSTLQCICNARSRIIFQFKTSIYVQNMMEGYT